MNISISETGSVSMSMNIDFRLYAKFRNEQICEDTLSKITVVYDEDEECSLLDIAKAFRTSNMMTLLSEHDPMVYAFDTVTAPEGESFCFVHNVYGSEQEALLALAVLGRAIIELAEDDVALIIDMTDYDNEYFGNHIMYYLGGELDEVKQYTVRGLAGSSHHEIEISDFNKMLKDADLSYSQKKYLRDIAPEPHPTELMNSMKWWTKKKPSEKKKTTGQTKKTTGQKTTRQKADNSNSDSDTPEALEAKKEAALKRGFMALEDAEWEEAEGFFETVLSYDAESSKAYLGRFLADNIADSINTYEQKCLKQIDKTINEMGTDDQEQSGRRYETITACNIDEAFIEDVITKYSIPYGSAELKPTRIKQEFDYDRTYTTIINAIEEYKKRTIKELKDDKNLIKAKRYGDEELSQSIQQLEDSIIKKFDHYISEESKKNKERDEQIPVLYREHLNSVASKIEGIHRNVQLKKKKKRLTIVISIVVIISVIISIAITKSVMKKNKYDAALKAYNTGDYAEAKRLFSTIKDYKDSEYYYFKASVASAEKGNTITFGAFEQDNDISRKEPIEWTVLDVQDDRILIISNYVLIGQDMSEMQEFPSWEKCGVRKWLNDTFVSTAFSDDEEIIILETVVKNENCGDTKDRAFILSKEELEKYFPNERDRITDATEYAKAGGNGLLNMCYSRGDPRHSYWWLRSQIYDDLFDEGYIFQGIDYAGQIDEYGYLGNLGLGVRPVMWIKRY